MSNIYIYIYIYQYIVYVSSIANYGNNDTNCDMTDELNILRTCSVTAVAHNSNYRSALLQNLLSAWRFERARLGMRKFVLPGEKHSSLRKHLATFCDRARTLKGWSLVFKAGNGQKAYKRIYIYIYIYIYIHISPT